MCLHAEQIPATVVLSVPSLPLKGRMVALALPQSVGELPLPLSPALWALSQGHHLASCGEEKSLSIKQWS